MSLCLIRNISLCLIVGVDNKSEVKSNSRMKIITEIIITKNKILLLRS